MRLYVNELVFFMSSHGKHSKIFNNVQFVLFLFVFPVSW